MYNYFEPKRTLNNPDRIQNRILIHLNCFENTAQLINPNRILIQK